VTDEEQGIWVTTDNTNSDFEAVWLLLAFLLIVCGLTLIISEALS
jgi:hypothetical protein